MTSPAPGTCPDAETVAAWADRALGVDEATLVEAHLSACVRCQEVLATLVRTGAVASPFPAVVPSDSLWRRWHLQWLVPAAAAATAVAVWIAVPANRPSVPTSPFEASSTAPPPAQLPTALGRDDTAEIVGRDSSAANDDTERRSESARVALEPGPSPTVSELAASAPAGRAAEAPVAADTSLGQTRTEASNKVSAEIAAPASPQPAAAPPTSPAGQSVLSGRRQGAVSSPARANAAIEIASPNPVNRWRIVAGTRVERSTSAGSAWEPAVVSAPTQLAAGSSPGPTVCWLAGRAGGVWLTTDGTRFDRLPFPEPVDLLDVRATSATSAIVTTADGRAFRTNDGGATWNLVSP